MEWFDQFDPDNELDNLRIRMCPPRVVIDNEACGDSTLVRVESVNKHGILVEVVQVLAKFDLIVKKAYITSINTWFIDVFYVIDQDGKKITNEGLIHDIQQVPLIGNGIFSVLLSFGLQIIAGFAKNEGN